MNYRRYEEYKTSGVSWLDPVPAYWQVIPLFSVLQETSRSNIALKEQNLLSLSYGRIIRKPIDTTDGLLPQSFEGYQVVDQGEITLRLTDLQNDQRSLRVGFVPERGIITSAYVNLKGKPGLLTKFLFYQLYAIDVQKVFYALGAGVRQSISYFDLRRIALAIPSPDEQRDIVEFLDHETGRIDSLIGPKFRPPDSPDEDNDSPAIRLLRRLSEYRSSLIVATATGQIDVRNYGPQEVSAVCQ